MLSRKRVNTFDDREQLRKKRKRDNQDALTFKSENSDETESQLHLYLEVSDEETDPCSNIGLSDLKWLSRGIQSCERQNQFNFRICV